MRQQALGWFAQCQLFDEEVFPVCSPAHFSNKKVPLQPKDLVRYLLIHDMDAKNFVGFPDWHKWFAHAGLPTSVAARGLEINSSGMPFRPPSAGRALRWAEKSS